MAGRLLPAGAQPPCRGAVDRRARQPRSCNRAGQGWWRFLDPRPVAPRQDCNVAADDDIGNYSDAYAVPLGSSTDTQFIVFDSSNVGVTPLNPADLMYRNYRSEMEYAFARTAQAPQVFFLSHHPVLGFAPNPGKPESPYPGNAGLQSVMAALHSSALVPANVVAMLSGHNHCSSSRALRANYPPQFIAATAASGWISRFRFRFRRTSNRRRAPWSPNSSLPAASAS
jgi:hypothetical protein